MNKLKVAVAAALTALALTGCGSDAGMTDMPSYESDKNAETWVVTLDTGEQATCFWARRGQVACTPASEAE